MAKKNTFEYEARRRLKKTSSFKFLELRRNALVNDPDFNFELSNIKRINPIPSEPKILDKCMELDFRYSHGKNKLDKIESRMIKYAKPWRIFCEKWQISYPALVYSNSIDPLALVELGVVNNGTHKGKPCMILLSKEVTENTIKHYAPMLMLVKNSTLGVARITQGRKKIGDNRNNKIRKDYNKLKLEVSRGSYKVIRKRLAEKYGLSEMYISQIIY